MTSSDGSVVVESLLVGRIETTPHGSLVLSTVTSIRRGPQHVLIDTGGFNQWTALKDRLEELPTVTAIVLTHFHWDHCANVRHFPGIPIYASGRPLAVDRATLTEVLGYPWIAVREGDVVANVAEIWEVPGHTSNHLAVSVVMDTGRVTVAGDAIATVQDAIEGVPRLVFYSRPRASCSLSRILAQSDWIIPGHGEAFSAKRLGPL